MVIILKKKNRLIEFKIFGVFWMKISKDTPLQKRCHFFKNTPSSKPQKAFEGVVFLVNTADLWTDFL